MCGGGGYLAGHVWWCSGGCDWFAWEIETNQRDKDREREERKEWKRYNFLFIYNLYGLYYFNQLDVKIEIGMLEEL